MKNRIIVYLTVLAIALIITLPTVYKVVKLHQDRLLTVTEKKIIETAKDCYYNSSCVDNIITLSELYEKTDLETMVNPITKEVYSEDSYVDVLNNFEFISK